MLAALTAMRVGQNPAGRIVNLLVGVGLLGYGIYLGFIFNGGTYVVFFQVFILPVLLVISSLRSAARRLGVAGGMIFGVLLGQVRFLADVLGPYIKAMNALLRIVLGSIFVVWLGLGTTSKVMLAAVLVFFVVFFNAFQGVREVDRNFIAGARVLGASRFQIVRHVVLPSALTWIIASLHVAGAWYVHTIDFQLAGKNTVRACLN